MRRQQCSQIYSCTIIIKLTEYRILNHLLTKHTKKKKSLQQPDVHLWQWTKATGVTSLKSYNKHNDKNVQFMPTMFTPRLWPRWMNEHIWETMNTTSEHWDEWAQHLITELNEHNIWSQLKLNEHNIRSLNWSWMSTTSDHTELTCLKRCQLAWGWLGLAGFFSLSRAFWIISPYVDWNQASCGVSGGWEVISCSRSIVYSVWETKRTGSLVNYIQSQVWSGLFQVWGCFETGSCCKRRGKPISFIFFNGS